MLVWVHPGMETGGTGPADPYTPVFLSEGPWGLRPGLPSGQLQPEEAGAALSRPWRGGVTTTSGGVGAVYHGGGGGGEEYHSAVPV